MSDEVNPLLGILLRHAGWVAAGALALVLVGLVLIWLSLPTAPPDPPPPAGSPACTDCGCSARAEPCRAAKQGRCKCKKHGEHP